MATATAAGASKRAVRTSLTDLHQQAERLENEARTKLAEYNQILAQRKDVLNTISVRAVEMITEPIDLEGATQTADNGEESTAAAPRAKRRAAAASSPTAAAVATAAVAKRRGGRRKAAEEGGEGEGMTMMEAVYDVLDRESWPKGFGSDTEDGLKPGEVMTLIETEGKWKSPGKVRDISNQVSQALSKLRKDGYTTRGAGGRHYVHEGAKTPPWKK
jgi:hypothetical protein